MKDISKLNNSTIAKLNRDEMSILGLYNKGIMTYKGELKSRKQGYKTVKVSDYQTDFVNEHTTLEFIKIVPLGSDTEYAMRVRETGTDYYDTDVMPLWGCDFFK